MINQPHATIDLTESVADLARQQITIPILYDWQFIHEASGAHLAMPCVNVNTVSIEAALQCNNRVRTKYEASLISLSFSVLESSAMRVDQGIEQVTRADGQEDFSLIDLHEPHLERLVCSEEITGSLFRHLNNSFSSRGLSLLQEDLAHIREDVDLLIPVFRNHGLESVHVEKLSDSINELDAAIQDTSKIVAAQALLATVIYSSKHVRPEIAADLCDVLQAADRPFERLCARYTELMAQVVDSLTEAIEKNPEHDMCAEESMVRTYVDPIDDARSLVIDAGHQLRSRVSQFSSAILAKLEDF
jgi:hypothetical protein